MSARDIEGENPLYLPQAKVYDSCCALGPSITLAAAMPPHASIGIRMEIDRDGARIFAGETSVARMARRFEELIDWLGRDNRFPERSHPVDGHRHRAAGRFQPEGRRPGTDHDRRDRHA